MSVAADLIGELSRSSGGTEEGKEETTVGLALNGEASAGEATRRSQQLLRVATASRCVAAREGTARGRRAVGSKQAKQEKQAAAGALFMTETLPFSSLDLPI